MSANLEEKIKKESEQLEKSESLLEKTVKKAMNFGRRPKNVPKKETGDGEKRQAEEKKEEAKSAAKEPAKKKKIGRAHV